MTALQQEILEIFKEVEKIINKYQLNYTVMGGSAIGAVRHYGFIPWDDDMDIIMLRADYDKLLKILPKELPAHLELRTANHSPSDVFKFSKVMNKNTCVIEGLLRDFPELDEGVYLDIMPVDNLPDNKIVRAFHLAKLSVFNKLEYYTTFSIRAFPKRKIWFIMIYPWRFILPVGYLQKKYYKEATRYNENECEHLCFKWNLPASRNTLIRREWFDDFITIPFENTEVSIFKEYDQYLKVHFGDYMKLPSLEQQVSHHGFVVVDLNTPYREYRKRHAFSEEELN